MQLLFVAIPTVVLGFALYLLGVRLGRIPEISKKQDRMKYAWGAAGTSLIVILLIVYFLPLVLVETPSNDISDVMDLFEDGVVNEKALQYQADRVQKETFESNVNLLRKVFLVGGLILWALFSLGYEKAVFKPPMVIDRTKK